MIAALKEVQKEPMFSKSSKEKALFVGALLWLLSLMLIVVLSIVWIRLD
jgi:hypothetical protein